MSLVKKNEKILEKIGKYFTELLFGTIGFVVLCIPIAGPWMLSGIIGQNRGLSEDAKIGLGLILSVLQILFYALIYNLA